MVFTKATEYALKAIVYMAKHKNQEFFGVRELAEELDVSSSYLAKILQRLGKDGLLKSVTGPGGGFGLGKDPARIRLMDILESMDDQEFLTKCVLGWGKCGDSNPCPFHHRWETFRKDLKSHLLSTRIDGVSDLIWPEFNDQVSKKKLSPRPVAKGGGN